MKGNTLQIPSFLLCGSLVRQYLPAGYKNPISFHPLGTTILVSASVNLTILDSIYKWDHEILVSFWIWLISLGIKYKVPVMQMYKFLGGPKCGMRTIVKHTILYGFSGGSDGKESAFNAGDLGLTLGLGRSPGEGNDNPLQYSCLRISWTEEPDGLQPMGSQRVGHDCLTNTHVLYAWHLLVEWIINYIFSKNTHTNGLNW